MITVIGSMNMDVMVTTERIPDKGETLFGTHFQTSPGGKGANQAIAAARLGGDVQMVGCVGDDAFGRSLTAALEKEKINVSNVSVTDEAATGIANVIVSEADNRIIVVPGANYAFGRSEAAAWQGVIRESSLVVLQMEILPEAIEAILSECRAHNIPVLFNPAPATNFDLAWMDAITVLTPNEQECEYIFGMDTTRALEQYPNQLIVTLGDEGAAYFDGETHVHVPRIPADVVDTTGAGDAFNGALAYAMANNQSLDKAVLFANAAGSLAVQTVGAQSGMPSQEAVWKRMEKSGISYGSGDM